MFAKLTNRRAQINSRKRSAFTLVEIMIVVLIIGILLAIAVPNFVRARETARGKSCVANLKQYASAKDQWALANGKKGADVPTDTDLIGPDSFIKATPVCPSNGTYTIGAVSADPTCNAVAPTYAPHSL